ncbi:MAG: zinc ribbon domain-containing protein [Syntrophobacteraceae bacterium]|nr:zinc ribbon domain-containing protein [Syntrophobacteraceae bacterium]
MPIYEFRCTGCGQIQEFLLTRSSEQMEMVCRQCGGDEMERVMSQVNYAMGESASSSAAAAGPSATTRSCGPGNSCTTIELPGHTR